MATPIHILNASGSLDAFQNDLKAIVRRCLKEASRLLAVRTVDIVFQAAGRPGSLQRLGGIAGYCPRGDYIRISIDRFSFKSRHQFRKDLRRSLLHELHHAARGQRGFPLSGCSVFEQLITEGLADNFVYEVTGEVPSWARGKQSPEMMLRSYKHFFKKKSPKLSTESSLQRDREKNISNAGPDMS